MAQGELDRARELQEQVLKVTRRQLGEEHPETLTAMSDLATRSGLTASSAARASSRSN